MNPTTTELVTDDVALVARAFERAAGELVPEAPVAVVFEAPRNSAFGDFATNVALRLAKRAGRKPQDLATELVVRAYALVPSIAGVLASEPTATAGFINIRLAPGYWQRLVGRVLREGADFGRAATPTGETVSLEFGSANPTGPVLVVQGRTLSLGDALARTMRFCGVAVITEWIVNDAGSQMDTLGRSVYARYRQIADPAVPFPEDGYPAAYLLPVAEALRDADGGAWDDAPESAWLPYFRRAGRDALVVQQRATCERFGVAFDRWQNELELHENGLVMDGVADLARRGMTYESDGATWMATTRFGDDKDRVLVRSDGRPAYLAPDVAYHREKLARADRAILILGPDHHGYVVRLKAIAAAFDRPGAIDVLIAQQMTMLRNGEIVSMSKRSGDVLSLDDVLDEVGRDAARFFFDALRPDSPMTFDLSLAVEQSNENPVFYVQYGHARIASIERSARPEILARARRGEALERLLAPEELALARRLAELPDVARAVVATLDPSKLARYAQSVASEFTQFYVACRVLTDDAELSVARLGLALATKRVLATALGLLGVGAPEAMERRAADATSSAAGEATATP